MQFTDTIKLVAKKGQLSLLAKLLSDIPNMPRYSWNAQAGMLTPSDDGIYENIKFIQDLLQTPHFHQGSIKLLIEKMLAHQSQENINYFINALPLSHTIPFSQWLIENDLHVLLDMPVFQQLMRKNHINETIRLALINNDSQTLDKILHDEISDSPEAIKTTLSEQLKSALPESVKNFLYQYNGFFTPRAEFDYNIPMAHTAFASLAPAGMYPPATLLSPECARLILPYVFELDAQIESPIDAQTIAEKITTYGLADNPKALRALYAIQLAEMANRHNKNGFIQIWNEKNYYFDTGFTNRIAAKLIYRGLSDYAAILLNHHQSALPLSTWEHCVNQNYFDILTISGITPLLNPHKLRELIEKKALDSNLAMVRYLCNVAQAQNVTIIFDEPLLGKIQKDSRQGAAITFKLRELQQKSNTSYLNYFTTKMGQLGSYLLTVDNMIEEDERHEKERSFSFFGIGSNL